MNPTETNDERQPRLAVSLSRDSESKQQRLDEWAQRTGQPVPSPQTAPWSPADDPESRAKSLHERHQQRNRWTASKHDCTIAVEIRSDESANITGTRVDETIAAARQTGATVVLIVSLRRLGVGVAQILLRQRIEAAGLTIITEREAENRLLDCESSPTRTKLLGDIALADEYEWSVGNQRLAAARFDHWATPAGQATLDFIAARPHLNLTPLAAALKFYGHRTAKGHANWHRMTVKRARAKADARNRTGALQRGMG